MSSPILNTPFKNCFLPMIGLALLCQVSLAGKGRPVSYCTLLLTMMYNVSVSYIYFSTGIGRNVLDI
jgi:hypothetical protein